MQTDNTAAHDRPRITINLTVNGKPVEATIEPNELLLDFLRNRLGLTGAKRSCDVQVCGTCTVLLDGLPVSSCTTLAYEARGREVLTVEGLAQNGQLHPLQEAFVRHTALQCGFCTPGMVLTAKSLLDTVPRPSPEQIRAYLRGNLCRCTGYWHILEAVDEAAKVMAADGRAAEEEDRSR